MDIDTGTWHTVDVDQAYFLRHEIHDIIIWMLLPQPAGHCTNRGRRVEAGGAASRLTIGLPVVEVAVAVAVAVVAMVVAVAVPMTMSYRLWMLPPREIKRGLGIRP